MISYFSSFFDGRSPQGECGLKFDRVPAQLVHTVVAPRKGSVD